MNLLKFLPNFFTLTNLFLGCVAVVFGIIGTTFMPRNLIMPIRLIPLYIGAILGIGYDMRRVELMCDVSYTII